MTEKKNEKIKVFLLSTGLGHVHRGFEVFTRECFDALRGDPALDITLFKGGGAPAAQCNEIVLWNLPRSCGAADRLGKMVRRNGYIIEQLTFGVSLMPHVLRERPDVIYFTDWNIGKMLRRWRRVTGAGYRLLLCNGGAYVPPFPLWDHVQQVALPHLESALAAGQPAETQSLVPHAIPMEPECPVLAPDERRAVRERLSLPADRPIALSVAAVDKRVKRMDYVVREVAALASPRPFLLLLGQQGEETPQVRALAEELLGPEGFAIRTVPHGEMAQYYQVSDAFVLASLMEGFGLVLVEAMSYGLPCLAHDYSVPRFVLGEQGYMADLEKAGSLAKLLDRALKEDAGVEVRRARHQAVHERFSWERVRPQYVEMLRRCAAP